MKLAEGAEAIISLKNNLIIKERISKNYRLKVLDEKLRKLRTRKEAKILQKLNELHISSPKLITSCDKKMIIEMEYLEGEQLSTVIDENYSKQAGAIVGKMHENNIIHGDLTTANFVVKDDKVFIIDFGLSVISKRNEDKAVDLHLFERSLEAHHTNIKEDCWDAFLESYQKHKDSNAVIKQLEKVEHRGRNK